MTPTLEQLLTQDFGLSNPTPVQRAICRIADGRPLGSVYGHPEVVAAIGELPREKFTPLTMLLCCGIRGGKSQIAGAAAVRCGLSCDTSVMTSGGDVARVAILSTHKDQAKQTYDHLVYAFSTSERLRKRLVKPPTDRVLFYHDTGRVIEIVVVAGARAGVSLASKWLVAAIFDEAGKMIGADEGVVNLDDARQNVAGRLVPSGCCSEWLLSSPWAPFGPFYKAVNDNWKRPTRNMVVVRARGDWMNPVWWTPKRIEDVKRNPDAYKTDFLAEFADPESALIPGVHIEAAVRRGAECLVPENGYQYAAEMDPGVRSNAWTLVVTRMVGPKTQVVLAKEWRGTKTEPLAIKETLIEVRNAVLPYRIQRVGSDQYGIDFIREMGREVGLEVVEYPATRKSNDEGYVDLAQRFAVGEVEIPDNANMLSDLRRLVRKTVAAGVHVELPQTSDGRHCDFAPSLMRAAQRNTAQPAKVDERPQWKQEQDASLARAQKKFAPKQEVPWWKRSA